MDEAVMLEQARAAKSRAAAAFSKYGAVVGIGVTKFGLQYGLKVNFGALTAPRESLPTVWEGLPVECEVIGPITKRRLL